MNKGVIIGVVVLLLLLLVGGGFFLMNRNSTSSSTSKNTTNSVLTENVNEQTSGKTLRELMGMTANQTCTFNDNTSATEGTIYSGGGKFRGDFTSQVNGIASNTHILSDGGNMYMWIDGTTDGFKMAISDIDQFSNNSATQKSVDFNNQIDYKCSAWAVDNSMFDLPDIKFTDFGAMAIPTNTATEEGQTNTSSTGLNCEACDNLPAGEAQAQCKLALGC